MRPAGRERRAAGLLFLAAPIAVVVAGGVLPLLGLANQALQDDATSSGLGSVGLVLRTFALGALAGAIAVLVALPLALLLRGIRSRVAWLLRVVLLVPLALPPLLHAAGWSLALRPHGLLAGVASAIGAGESSAIEALESFGGCALVLALAYFPLPLVCVDQALRLASRDAMDAARSLGGSERRAFFAVHGAAVARALAAGFLLVLLLAVADCGAATLLEVDVLGFEVLTRLAAFHDSGAALALALPQIGVALAIGWMERRWLRPAAHPAWDVDPIARSRGGARAAAVVVLALLLVAPPFTAWITSADVVAAWRHAERPLGATVQVALATAAIVTVGGVLLGVSRRTRKSGRMPLLQKSRQRPESAATVLPESAAAALMLAAFALPTALLALGALAVSPSLSGTGVIAVILAAHYLVAGDRIAGRAIEDLPGTWTDAAASLGAGGVVVARRIALPIVAPALFATAAVAFALAAQDLGAAALLHAPGGEPLTVALLSIEANAKASLVAGMCLIAALVIVVPIAAVLVAGATRRKTANVESIRLAAGLTRP